MTPGRIVGSRLFLRYALLIVIVVSGLLCTLSAFEIVNAWRENELRTGLLLEQRSRAASSRIEEHLAGIEAQLRAVASMPWAAADLHTSEREFEYRRLQRVAPELMELRFVDAQRNTRLRVSQIDRNTAGEDEVLDPEIPAVDSADVAYGNAVFRGRTDPYAWLIVKESSGATAALVNMKFVSDFVSDLRFGATGRAFVVDGSGYVIAHPDLRLVLQRVNLAQHPELAALVTGPTRIGDARSFDGNDSFFAATPIGNTGWWAFVEQSNEEMLEPVRADARRAVLVALAGLGCAVLIALTLARHLAAPIVALREAAARIGAGDFNARVQAVSADEIADLANEFNAMADRLRGSYGELESKVLARTQELAQKKDEADRANAAKTRFLAAASHDLRQPMHAISLFVGILSERVMEAEARSVVSRIQTSVSTMEKLFSSLLDISKLDAGAVKPQIGEVDLGSMIESVAHNFSAQATSKGLSFKAVPTRRWVISDRVLLERIANNLVANAIRYTTAGRIVVGCRVRGHSVRLVVIDSGPGIAAEHLSDIFSEFFQLATPGVETGTGLGLGLAIVKRTADLLGHRVSVTSLPGRGSMFVIEMPLARMRTELPLVRAAGSDLPSPLWGAFVLVMDDHPDNRYATQTLVAQWGCHVVAAESPQAIIDQLQAHLRTPDLIISDLRLNDGANGVDAIAQVRSFADAAIPALIVTGDVTQLDSSDPMLAPLAVLHKPVSASVLRRAAENIVVPRVA